MCDSKVGVVPRRSNRSSLVDELVGIDIRIPEPSIRAVDCA